MQKFIQRELKVGCMLAPINIPIGIVVVYLVAALIMGSFQDAWSLMLISIICTAGISLIIWLPVWYWVGYAVVIPLRFAARYAGISFPGAAKVDQATQPEEAPVRAKLSRDQLVLLNYIKKAQQKGLSREQIQNSLTSNGWTAASIRAAFQLADSEPSLP